jgi:hypothetical protein
VTIQIQVRAHRSSTHRGIRRRSVNAVTAMYAWSLGSVPAGREGRGREGAVI